jgi:hypothetical protein
MTLMYIFVTTPPLSGEKMPTWKHTGKEVSKVQAEASLRSIKGACFGCGTHSRDCPIAKAAGEISEMLDCGALPVRDQIHAQITGALKGAKFPVKTPADLIAAFPDGADTTCRAGDLEMTAGEAGKLLKATDFPLKNARAVADLILDRAGL